MEKQIASKLISANLIKSINTNRTLKIVCYVGASLVIIYVLGKVMKVVATTISEFKILKTTIKGD